MNNSWIQDCKCGGRRVLSLDCTNTKELREKAHRQLRREGWTVDPASPSFLLCPLCLEAAPDPEKHLDRLRTDARYLANQIAKAFYEEDTGNMAFRVGMAIMTLQEQADRIEELEARGGGSSP